LAVVVRVPLDGAGRAVEERERLDELDLELLEELLLEALEPLDRLEPLDERVELERPEDDERVELPRRGLPSVAST
jgi:hypothetical protein